MIEWVVSFRMYREALDMRLQSERSMLQWCNLLDEKYNHIPGGFRRYDFKYRYEALALSRKLNAVELQSLTDRYLYYQLACQREKIYSDLMNRETNLKRGIKNVVQSIMCLVWILGDRYTIDLWLYHGGVKMDFTKDEPTTLEGEYFFYRGHFISRYLATKYKNAHDLRDHVVVQNGVNDFEIVTYSESRKRRAEAQEVK